MYIRGKQIRLNILEIRPLMPTTYFCSTCKREFARKYQLKSHECLEVYEIPRRVPPPPEEFCTVNCKSECGRYKNTLFKRFGDTPYFVSQDGQVYSSCKDIILKQRISRYGYAVVKFRKCLYRVHRLVFYVWNGYLPELIHHKDGNSLNNNLSNLEGMTRVEHGAYHKGIKIKYDKVRWSELPDDVRKLEEYHGNFFENVYVSKKCLELYRKRGRINPYYIKLRKIDDGDKRVFRLNNSMGALVEIVLSRK